MRLRLIRNLSAVAFVLVAIFTRPAPVQGYFGGCGQVATTCYGWYVSACPDDEACTTTNADCTNACCWKAGVNAYNTDIQHSGPGTCSGSCWCNNTSCGG